MAHSRRTFLSFAAAATGMALLPPLVRATPQSASLLFRDVRVVDGTGAAARTADVLVREGRIEGIGRIASRAAGKARVIAGGGRVLAPGFIDLHAHGNPLEHPYDSHLAMGATTIVLGQDGASPSKHAVHAWLDEVQSAARSINVATMTGHGSLRRLAGIDDATRDPSPAQLERMAALLDADLRAGSFGLSTGLEYVPGRYARQAEVASLGRVLAQYDAVAASHLRTEDDDTVEEAIREHIEASRPARTHISHLKVVYGKGEERALRLLDVLRAYRDQGIELTADAYPYEASYTTIGLLFPEWALPPTDYAAVRAQRQDELRAALEQRMYKRGGPEALLFGDGPHAGKTLAQLSQELGQPFPDVLLDLGPTAASAAHFVMDPALQARLMLDPFVAIASDGSPTGRHPRGHGTFARWIETFMVANGDVTLEEAIRKATTLPASILQLRDRGTIREGAHADLVLFDPARIRARASYVEPFARAEGFDMVVLGGTPAWEDGERVSDSGRVLRHRQD